MNNSSSNDTTMLITFNPTQSSVETRQHSEIKAEKPQLKTLFYSTKERKGKLSKELNLGHKNQEEKFTK